MGVRFVIVVLLALGLAFPAQAQVALEAKRAIRAAMTICIDWARGKTDYSKTPPAGFTAASPFEILGFTAVAGSEGRKTGAFWAEPHARFSTHALRLTWMDDTCVVLVPAAIAAPSLKDLVADVDAAAISHAGGRIRLGYYDSQADDEGQMVRFFESDDERGALTVVVMHGWKDGKPAPGQFGVGVRLQ